MLAMRPSNPPLDVSDADVGPPGNPFQLDGWRTAVRSALRTVGARPQKIFSCLTNYLILKRYVILWSLIFNHTNIFGIKVSAASASLAKIAGISRLKTVYDIGVYKYVPKRTNEATIIYISLSIYLFYPCLLTCLLDY